MLCLRCNKMWSQLQWLQSAGPMKLIDSRLIDWVLLQLIDSRLIVCMRNLPGWLETRLAQIT